MGNKRKQNQQKLRAVLNSRRRKRNDDLYKAMAVLEGKVKLRHKENQLDEEVIKYNRSNLSESFAIKMIYAQAMDKDIKDMMLASTEDIEYRRGIMRTYINYMTLRKYQRENLLGLVNRYLEHNKDTSSPYYLKLQKGFFDELESVSYLYQDDYDKVLTLSKNIPEMFDYISSFAELNGDNVEEKIKWVKNHVVDRLDDFTSGFIVTSHVKVTVDTINSIAKGEMEPLGYWGELRKEAVLKVARDPDLPREFKNRYVTRVATQLGFFNK